MYRVSSEYLDLATRKGRTYAIRLVIGETPLEEPVALEDEEEDKDIENGEEDPTPPREPVTVGGEDVLSLKIIRGRTTESFTLGETICATLDTKVTSKTQVRINDPIHVQVRFSEGETVTEWLSLGHFYVDSIKQNKDSKSVTAYDAMLQFSRLYDSTLQYPTSLGRVINEISTQTGISVSPRLRLFNDVNLSKKPQGNSETLYTRRDTLGYIAGVNGGSAYIDTDETINISTPTETGYTIDVSSVTEQSIQDTDYKVEGITWNTQNQTLSIGDDYAINTLDVYSPLPYVSHIQMLDNMDANLIGLAFDSVKIKKQGTGLFQLGDLVDYNAVDGKTYRMLIIGITYDFSGGFFFETLYSMAQSASQQRNQGNKQGYVTPTYEPSDVVPSTITKFAYTTSVRFRSNGFVLGFVTSDGEADSNEFEYETVGGRITKLVNKTAKKEVEITYE